jgi:hypothetical protein
VALVYRFPIPLGGYASGFLAAMLSVLAVLVYGVLLGGFVVLACAGALAGVLIYRSARPNFVAVRSATVACALVVDTTAAMLLALWDKIYGPW